MERPSKTLEIIFLIENLLQISGAKLGSLNTTIEELISEIRDIAETRPNDNVNIRCISYSNGSQWRCLDHVPVRTFRWEYLTAEGKCDLGSGLLRLNKFLAEKDLSIETHYRPVIFLINCSWPTDNFKYALFKIKGNEWYKRALKVGVSMGDDDRQEILQQFTGNARNIIKGVSPEYLKKWIQFFETR